MKELFYDDIDDIYERIYNAYANLYLLAIKKKVNLKTIVDSLSEDIDDYLNEVDEFVPKGMEGLLFLSASAKMLDVSLFDIIYLSDYDKEKIIQEIINEIDITEITDYDDLDVSEEGYCFLYDIVFNDEDGQEVDYELIFEYKDTAKISVEIYVDGEKGVSTHLIQDDLVLWEGTKASICQFIVETYEDITWEEEEKRLNEEANKNLDDDEDDYRNEEDNELIDYKDFFIHSNYKDCDHDYIKVMATVPIYTNWKVQTVTFEADYCAECGIYYISEYVYRNKIHPVGRLLCQVMSIDEYLNYKKQFSDFGELKPQGILNMIGYNVNAKDNLSEHERRTILRYAIEAGVITKKLTIFYLQTFIKKSEPKKGMEEAISKWKSDLQWVYNYDNKGDIIYGVRRIISSSTDGFMNVPEGIENDLSFR